MKKIKVKRGLSIAIVGMMVFVFFMVLPVERVEASPDYDFTFVWMTDTQFYSESYPTIYDNMTQWIVDNEITLNIKYVIHTGDIVNVASNTAQWDNANQSMTILDTNSIPYGVLAGNHDNNMVNYYKYFGYDRFKGKSYYGGNYTNNQNHYDLISCSNVDFIIIYLSCDGACEGITDAEFNWANQTLQEYSNRFGILAIHPYITNDGTYIYQGEEIYDKIVVPNKNVNIVLCGHMSGRRRNIKTADDRTVYEILHDYQSESNGGNGWMRLLQFDIDNNKIDMSSYSPETGTYNYFPGGIDNFDIYYTFTPYPKSDSSLFISIDGKSNTSYVGSFPIFHWSRVGQSFYELQIASDPEFNDIEHEYVIYWWDEHWTKRMKLILNNGGSPELLNYPLLIHLNDSIIDFTKIRPDGADIRFIDNDGLELNYEIERWNDTSKEAWIWVKVKKIDYDSNKDHIYIYYNNTNAEDNQNVNAVWDSYELVYHFNEEGSINPIDSSPNQNNGTGYNNVSNVDELGGGYRFDGDSGYVSIPAIDLDNTDFMVELIYNAPFQISKRPISQYANGSRNWDIHFTSEKKPSIWLNGQNGESGSTIHSTFAANETTLFSSIIDKDEDILALAGNDSGYITNSGYESSGDMEVSSHSIQIAKYFGHYFNGTIYELRITKNKQNYAWLYVNHRSIIQKNFIEYGDAENYSLDLLYTVTNNEIVFSIPAKLVNGSHYCRIRTLPMNRSVWSNWSAWWVFHVHRSTLFIELTETIVLVMTIMFILATIGIISKFGK